MAEEPAAAATAAPVRNDLREVFDMAGHLLVVMGICSDQCMAEDQIDKTFLIAKPM